MLWDQDRSYISWSVPEFEPQDNYEEESPADREPEYAARLAHDFQVRIELGEVR